MPIYRVNLKLLELFRRRFPPKALRAFIGGSSPGDDRSHAEAELSPVFPYTIDPEIRRDPDLPHSVRLSPQRLSKL